MNGSLADGTGAGSPSTRGFHQWVNRPSKQPVNSYPKNGSAILDFLSSSSAGQHLDLFTAVVVAFIVGLKMKTLETC